MSNHTPLPARTVKFRRLIIDRLWKDDSPGYVTKDRFVGTCPCCDGPVGVRFTGRTEIVNFECYGAGCPSAVIATTIGLVGT